jgi:hypothetical protein
MATPKKETGRQALKDAADKFSGDVAQFYKEVLGATKEVTVVVECNKCPGYKHNVKVPIADWSARTNALDKLLTAGYGKAVAEKQPEQNPAHVKTDELDNLTDDLLSLAAWNEGDTVTDHLRAQATAVLADDSTARTGVGTGGRQDLSRDA